MEDNKNMLSETNIEKAKALFEYEMTAVLLAAAEEKKAEQRLLDKYYEMEIEKPEVVFEAPEFEPESIEAALPESIAAAPETELPAVTVRVSGLPEIGEARSFSAPELKAGSGLREELGAFLPAEAVSGRHISAYEAAAPEDLREAVGELLPKEASAEGISVRGLNTEGAAEPVHVELGIDKLPAGIKPFVYEPAGAAVSAPELVLELVKPRELGLSAETPKAVPGIELPDIPAVGIAVEISPAAPKVRVSCPETGPAGVSFEKPAAEVRAEAVELPAAGVISLPEISALPKPEVSLAGDIQGAGEVRFELPRAEVKVSVDYRPAVPVSFELAETDTARPAAPEYPEIPDKPDIASAVDEILEAVRAEL